MSDATDNRFYREPAAPVVAGDLRERVIDKALDVLADAAVATQDEGSERLADTMLAVVQPELERLTKLAEANGGQARFWADHFAEIERANRDALGTHHKPGHSVAELIAALIGELAEVRQFGNDAMNSAHTKAQEIAKWVEGYGKLSADNKRLTYEQGEARAEVSRLERCYDAVKERAERAEARPAIPADAERASWANCMGIQDFEHKLADVPTAGEWSSVSVRIGSQYFPVTGVEPAENEWTGEESVAIVAAIPAPVSGSDTTEDGGDRG